MIAVSPTPERFSKRIPAGFTLLEIMVAMTILTLIVTAAFGALRLGERSWETGLKHTTESEILRTVTSSLQRLLSQTLPIRWKHKTETTIAFSGDRQQLRFIAPSPQHHGATGLFEYTLVLQPGADDYRLILYYRLHNPDIPGFAAEGSEQQKVTLVEGLDSAQFRYYGTPVKEDPPRWHDLWSIDAEAFPRLVHIQLEPGNAAKRWPELHLPLYAGFNQ